MPDKVLTGLEQSREKVNLRPPLVSGTKMMTQRKMFFKHSSNNY